jgi:hypothetical protein
LVCSAEPLARDREGPGSSSFTRLSPMLQPFQASLTHHSAPERLFRSTIEKQTALGEISGAHAAQRRGPLARGRGVDVGPSIFVTWRHGDNEGTTLGIPRSAVLPTKAGTAVTPTADAPQEEGTGVPVSFPFLKTHPRADVTRSDRRLPSDRYSDREGYLEEPPKSPLRKPVSPMPYKSNGRPAETLRKPSAAHSAARSVPHSHNAASRAPPA